MTDKPSKASDPLQSAYERFCEKHGGAVRPSPNFLEIEYSWPLQEYPYHLFKKIIEPWQGDRTIRIRHYPPMAYAVGQFAFRSKMESENSEELQPAEVRNLLQDIQNTSKQLAEALCRLQKCGFQVHDPTAALRSEHLAWLDAFVAQATAGNRRDKIDEHPKQATITQLERCEFLKRLEQIEKAAEEAQNRVDDDLLRRKPGPRTSAIAMFVNTVAPLWEDLTGKKATAYRAGGQTSEECPFVQFVGQLAEIAGEAAPSWKVVNTALKSCPPR